MWAWAASASWRTSWAVSTVIWRLGCAGSFRRAAGLALSQPSSTPSLRMLLRTVCTFLAVAGLGNSCVLNQCLIAGRSSRASGVVPQAGVRYVRRMDALRSRVRGLWCAARVAVHCSARAANVRLPSAGSSHSPVAMAVPWACSQRSASRLRWKVLTTDLPRGPGCRAW